MNQYTLKTRESTSDPVLAGRLEDVLGHRFDSHRGRKWMCQLRDNGNLVNCTPRERNDDAARHFARILNRDSKPGQTWVIKTQLGWSVRVIVHESVAGDRVIDAAKSEIGSPYVFGVANGPEDPGKDAFDCSGFTLWAWATVGAYLPHSAEAQRTAGNVHLFRNQADCQHADLVLMHFPNSRGIPSNQASHVGLWAGENTMLDTRSPSEPVAFRSIELGNVLAYGRVSGHPLP
ncbi:MAG: C40 family peptidase [Actinomycetota bacterium]|nr:C40 family peptidase [Actinomycetota bacterium]